MLTFPEKIVFIIVLLLSVVLSIRTFTGMIKIIGRGEGKLHWDRLPSRIGEALSVLVTQKTVFRNRPFLSLIHALLAWAFILYFVVNIGDVLYGFIPQFHFLGRGTVGNVYRLFVDIFSVLALAAMVYFLLRRFVFRSEQLQTEFHVPLMDSARRGMRRDSLIVGGFILLHVGFRFVGESLLISQTGTDAWQPFASAVSGFWISLGPEAIEIIHHASWWLAIGLILAFIPYFPVSKHAHLFMGPVNYMTRKRRSAPGTMEPLDFEAEDAEQFGVSRLEHLEKSQILDAYACIMCNRCQDACPAYVTGKELSPAALEINKRYYINNNKADLAAGRESGALLMDYAISGSALWACTSCAACVEVCPVGNEPMFDILNIRRDRVMMESDFPKELQGAFNGMERNSNPWNMNEDRLNWAESDPGLEVKTVEQNPDFDILFWVGCAGAFESRAQSIARAFVKILNAAGVNFAVLGNKEKCTGDSARRAGNEYLFSMMAAENVEMLNSSGVKKIVVICPHCLHTLKNEYPQFGGNYEVIHHTEYINTLIREGNLTFSGPAEKEVTFHDPCFLGRHNLIFEDPRHSLTLAGVPVREMPRNRENSFCCGAGGGQMWKEEEKGREDVRKNRFNEAAQMNVSTLATGCPFCMIMLSDAGRETESQMQVSDIAEIVAARL